MERGNAQQQQQGSDMDTSRDDSMQRDDSRQQNSGNFASTPDRGDEVGREGGRR